MIYSNHEIFFILLIYVNDILIIGNNAGFINNLIHKLNSVFSLKDLGELSYFLGLKVTQTSEGLHLNKKVHPRSQGKGSTT